MADNRIEITTNSLDNDIKTMNTSLQDITKQLNKMFESVKALDRMWDGPANSAFNQQITKDQNTMVEICAAVDKYIGCMEYASKEYVKCENTVDSAIAAVKI